MGRENARKIGRSRRFKIPMAAPLRAAASLIRGFIDYVVYLINKGWATLRLGTVIVHGHGSRIGLFDFVAK